MIYNKNLNEVKYKSDTHNIDVCILARIVAISGVIFVVLVRMDCDCNTIITDNYVQCDSFTLKHRV